MHATHAPSSNDCSTYLATAIQAAEAAGTVLRDYAKSGFRIDYKAAINLVTDADRQAEEQIVRTILSAYPSHRILAEERGQDGSTDSPYQWIIDPLDGTTNFAHGFPFYSVSIGLEYNGESILGVVLDPVRGELFTSIAGQGAYLNGARLHVSSIDSLDHLGKARYAACVVGDRNAAVPWLFVASSARFFLLSRYPAFRCRRTRVRTGKG